MPKRSYAERFDKIKSDLDAVISDILAEYDRLDATNTKIKEISDILKPKHEKEQDGANANTGTNE